MIPRPHQEEISSRALYLLRNYSLAYIATEERTGKTLAAILTAERLNEVSDVLIITKLKALPDWEKTIAAYEIVDRPTKLNIEVINYHKACKVEYKPNTLIILDEAHAYLAAFPKVGKIWKDVKKLCATNKILYLSATPYAQGPQQLYNQFSLSSYSPWKKFSSFYSWFAVYGIPTTLKVQGRIVNTYDKVLNNEVLETVKYLFIKKTRRELGFEHEPEDKLHYVELSDVTKSVYNDLLEDRVVELGAGLLVCDTVSKLRFALHMLEGGVAKIKDVYHVLKNREKIDYIQQHFGDTKDMVIMYNYIAEGIKLQQEFKNAQILQATSYAEGVDLSMFKHLIIYSMNFSTSKYVQRRARQANMNRKEEITVHFLLVKKAISSDVYKTVAINKRNYVDSLFSGAKI